MIHESLPLNLWVGRKCQTWHLSPYLWISELGESVDNDTRVLTFESLSWQKVLTMIPESLPLNLWVGRKCRQWYPSPYIWISEFGESVDNDTRVLTFESLSWEKVLTMMPDSLPLNLWVGRKCWQWYQIPYVWISELGESVDNDTWVLTFESLSWEKVLTIIPESLPLNLWVWKMCWQWYQIPYLWISELGESVDNHTRVLTFESLSWEKVLTIIPDSLPLNLWVGRKCWQWYVSPYLWISELGESVDNHTRVLTFESLSLENVLTMIPDSLPLNLWVGRKCWQSYQSPYLWISELGESVDNNTRFLTFESLSWEKVLTMIPDSLPLNLWVGRKCWQWYQIPYLWISELAESVDNDTRVLTFESLSWEKVLTMIPESLPLNLWVGRKCWQWYQSPYLWISELGESVDNDTRVLTFESLSWEKVLTMIPESLPLNLWVGRKCWQWYQSPYLWISELGKCVDNDTRFLTFEYLSWEKVLTMIPESLPLNLWVGRKCWQWYQSPYLWTSELGESVDNDTRDLTFESLSWEKVLTMIPETLPLNLWVGRKCWEWYVSPYLWISKLEESVNNDTLVLTFESLSSEKVSTMIPKMMLSTMVVRGMKSLA